MLFLLFVQFAYSQSYALVKRDGGATQAASPTSAPARSITTDSAGQDRDGQKLGGSTALPDRSDVSGFITIISPSTQTAASSVLPTATSSGIPDSSNFYNGRWIKVMRKATHRRRYILICGFSNNPLWPITTATPLDSGMGSRWCRNACDWRSIHAGWYQKPVDTHLLLYRIHDGTWRYSADRLRYQCPLNQRTARRICRRCDIVRLRSRKCRHVLQGTD